MMSRAEKRRDHKETMDKDKQYNDPIPAKRRAEIKKMMEAPPKITHRYTPEDKIEDGRGMKIEELGGYRGWARTILMMTNDEILAEKVKIKDRTTELSRRSREFCLEIAQKIIETKGEIK